MFTLKNSLVRSMCKEKRYTANNLLFFQKASCSIQIEVLKIFVNKYYSNNDFCVVLMLALIAFRFSRNSYSF